MNVYLPFYVEIYRFLNNENKYKAKRGDKKYFLYFAQGSLPPSTEFLEKNSYNLLESGIIYGLHRHTFHT